MRKLGKKLHATEETIETYCKTCSYCGCGSCPSSCYVNDPSGFIYSSSESSNVERTSSTNSSYGSQAALGGY